jgi:single-stranded-DNA-specific exonuclease
VKLAAEDFLESFQPAVDVFRSSVGMVRIISHLDSDGICASGILIKASMREKRRHSLCILPQLDIKSIRQFANEPYGLFIFSDLGSSQLGEIAEVLKDKRVIVLDHHRPKPCKPQEGHVHVNPHLHGIDGSREISGAGVTYLFAKLLNSRNDSLAFLAVIGAIGDNQERWGFKGISADILKIAEASGRMEVRQGLRLFGAQSRPLYKIIEQSYDLFIPGATGSTEGAMKLLEEAGLSARTDSRYTRLEDIGPEGQERLRKAIIARRDAKGIKGEIFGKLYYLPKEPEGPFRDAREFSTVLNACGRLNKAAVGIGAALGSAEMKAQAERVLADYRREIQAALQWYNESKRTSSIRKGKGYLIINAKNNIMPTLIGTVASIFSYSDEIMPGTVIVALSRVDHDTTKISFRVKGESWIDLSKLAKDSVKKLSGECGGHKNASGAFIKAADESAFMDSLEEILKKHSMTEVV